MARSSTVNQKNLFRLNMVHRNIENGLTEVSRFTQENLPKYRQINYDAMRNIITQRKQIGSLALERVDKLQQESQNIRDKSELKKLQHYWLIEQKRLNQHYMRQDADHSQWLISAFADDDLRSVMNDINRFRIWIDDDFIKFRKTTVQPIISLRDDLQLQIREQNNEIDERAVFDAIQSVKIQQNELIEILRDEERRIAVELKEFQATIEDDENQIENGIPDRIVHLDCPDDELKVTMLQEFLIIDHKYQEKLVDLDTMYLSTISMEYGGYGIDEHELFLHLYDMYPTHINQRRTLIYDHLKKHFPKRSRQEMLKHEEWCNAEKYYHKHKRLIYYEWKQARIGLELRTEACFQEAFEIQERLAQQREESAKQRSVCEQLALQVQKWRDKQLEVLAVQEMLNDAKRKEELEKIQQEHEREQKHRQVLKEKLADYHSRKDQERSKNEELERKRLEEMQAHLADQANKDWERIRYRKEEFDKKRQEMHEKEEAQKQDERERQQRLDALTELVRPHVESDFSRVMQPTKAFNAKRGLVAGVDDDIVLQQPLFPIHTFTDRKLYGDIRIRLEQRLRDAGLIQTDYARQALAKLQQPTKRIDTIANKEWTGYTFKDIPQQDSTFYRPIKRDFISNPVSYGMKME